METGTLIASIIAGIAAIGTFIAVWIQTQTLKKLENYDYNQLCNWIIEKAIEQNLLALKTKNKASTSTIRLSDLYKQIPKEFKCKDKASFLKAISQLDREDFIQMSLDGKTEKEEEYPEKYMDSWAIAFSYINRHKHKTPIELEKIRKELQKYPNLLQTIIHNINKNVS